LSLLLRHNLPGVLRLAVKDLFLVLETVRINESRRAGDLAVRANADGAIDSCTLPMLHRTDASRQTVDMGQSRLNELIRGRSALPRTAEVKVVVRNRRYVPKSDIARTIRWL